MEIKDVLESLGLPQDLDSTEKIVEAHRNNYLLKSEAHEDEDVKGKITGKLLGELTTKAKKLFGFSNEDIKDKHFKDILTEGVESYKTKLTELEEQSTKGGDEVVNKLKTDLEKLKTQANQYKGDLEKVLGEKTELETTFTNKLKQFKVDSVYKEQLSKIPFSEQAGDVAKLGFNTLIQSKYKIDLDETENVIVMDEKGQKIPHPQKTGVYLGLGEVLEMEAKKANILKQNNAGNTTTFRTTQQAPQAPEKPVRQVNSRAAENAEKHKKFA